MTTASHPPRVSGSHAPDLTRSPNWAANARLLWQRRRLLMRVALVALPVSMAVALLIPRQYEATARLMPPASNSGTAMLAALSGHAEGFGLLSGLAGSLFGFTNSTPLFMDMLRSGTVSGALIDRFQLQHVYRCRYRVDAAKRLARRTKIVDDKRSGVITVTVSDGDPVRARDLAQGYIDQLNQLVNHASTSSAHQERLFIEKRLEGVKTLLNSAQLRLSEFSATHSTVDMKEQTRATVDAASRLEAEMIVEQASLDSLRQTYGDANIRVRSAQARIAVLRGQIAKIGGSAADAGASPSATSGELSPPLRQLPRLAVPYAELYREVHVQETVFELLTQQYELARIQEAKDVPVINVIDAPGIPEKKSFPPRTLVTLGMTSAALLIACVWVLVEYRWSQVDGSDARKQLVADIDRTLRPYFRRSRAAR